VVAVLVRDEPEHRDLRWSERGGEGGRHRTTVRETLATLTLVHYWPSASPVLRRGSFAP
jgi:hypothetical protein